MRVGLRLCRRRVLHAERLLLRILDSKTLEMELQAEVRAFLGEI